MPHRFWTCTIITTISALVSASFSVAGLLAPSSSDSFARYAASRSIALLIGEDLRPVCFCPRELRWACVAAALTERVGEKVFDGRHLLATKPKVNSEHI
jgi:hypothetical protein